MRSRKQLDGYTRDKLCAFPGCEIPRWPSSRFCRHHHEQERALVELAKGGRCAWPPGWQMPIRKTDESNRCK